MSTALVLVISAMLKAQTAIQLNLGYLQPDLRKSLAGLQPHIERPLQVCKVGNETK